MATIPYLTIPLDSSALTEAAKQMIISMGRNPQASRFIVRGVDVPRPTVRLRSTLSYTERVLKHGVQGRIFADETAARAYAERLLTCYDEETLNRQFSWQLPTDGVSRAQENGQAGAAWLNRQAEMFADWCVRGDFEPLTAPAV